MARQSALTRRRLVLGRRGSSRSRHRANPRALAAQICYTSLMMSVRLSFRSTADLEPQSNEAFGSRRQDQDGSSIV